MTLERINQSILDQDEISQLLDEVKVPPINGMSRRACFEIKSENSLIVKIMGVLGLSLGKRETLPHNTTW